MWNRSWWPSRAGQTYSVTRGTSELDGGACVPPTPCSLESHMSMQQGWSTWKSLPLSQHTKGLRAECRFRSWAAAEGLAKTGTFREAIVLAKARFFPMCYALGGCGCSFSCCTMCIIHRELRFWPWAGGGSAMGVGTPPLENGVGGGPCPGEKEELFFGFWRGRLRVGWLKMQQVKGITVWFPKPTLL